MSASCHIRLHEGFALLMGVFILLGQRGVVCRNASDSPSLSMHRTSTKTLSVSNSVPVSPSYDIMQRSSRSETVSSMMTCTTTLKLTLTGSTDRTESPSAVSVSKTKGSLTPISSESVVFTKTHKSLTRSQESASQVGSSSPSGPSASRSASSSSQVSASHSALSSSAERSVSVSVSGSYSWSVNRMGSFSRSGTLRPTDSRTYGGRRGAKRLGEEDDFSITATRSPSHKPQLLRDSATVTLKMTVTASRSTSFSSAASKSRSSSNFLAGVGINNPALYYRLRHAFFSDPSTCSPKVLVTVLPPLTLTVLFALVWLVASSCGTSDANRCLPEDAATNVAPLRWMAAHHAYSNAVAPCHLRCIVLHGVELCSHMSVVVAVLVAVALALPGGERVSDGPLVAMGFLGALVAATVRHFVMPIAWRQGERRTIRKTVPLSALPLRSAAAVQKRRPRDAYVEEFVQPMTLSSDEELDFPAEFDKKPPKPKRQRALGLEDFVAHEVEKRNETLRRANNAAIVADPNHITDDAEDVVAFDEAQFVSSGMPKSSPLRGGVNIPMTSASVRVANGDIVFDDAVPEVLPDFAPDWMFDLDELDPEESEATKVISSLFRPRIQAPSHSEHKATEEMDAKAGIVWKKIAVGPNYLLRALVLNALIAVVCWGVAFYCSEALQRRLGSDACSRLGPIFAITFVVGDALVVQTAYAAWKGWRRRLWKFCCTVIVVERPDRRGASDDDDEDADDSRDDDVEPLSLHPKY